MFIDTSYFTGPLTIAQLGQTSVDDKVNDFITRYEGSYMEAALGNGFYQSFLSGIDVGSDESTAQRWIDLLNGIAFTDYRGLRRKWVGFSGGSVGSSKISTDRPDLFIYAGITAGFPLGGDTYTAPDLANYTYALESFGEGTLEPGVEWNYKVGGGFVLAGGYITAPNERFILHFTGQVVLLVSGGAVKVSPLAGFIYYEYMRDIITQNTGIGMVKNKGENSSTGNGVRKAVQAYNDAVTQIHSLWDLLCTDSMQPKPVYPEFGRNQIDSNCIRFKNHYGI